jgi:hypothetical protein
MNLRVFIVLLAVVGALIVIGLLAGVASGDETDNLRPGTLERLRRSQPLEASDIDTASSATCLQQFEAGLIALTAGTSCRFDIGSAGGLLPVARAVEVLVLQGQAVTVTLTQSDQLSIEQSLAQGASDTFDIFDEGGTLEVTCTQPGFSFICQVQVS